MVYEALRSCRDLSLKDQKQRAAVSIASNIAEGSERPAKDFARMLGIARGSAAELRTQAYIAGKVNLIEQTTMNAITTETKELAKMIYSLARKIKQAEAVQLKKPQ